MRFTPGFVLAPFSGRFPLADKIMAKQLLLSCLAVGFAHNMEIDVMDLVPGGILFYSKNPGKNGGGMAENGWGHLRKRG